MVEFVDIERLSAIIDIGADAVFLDFTSFVVVVVMVALARGIAALLTVVVVFVLMFVLMLVLMFMFVLMLMFMLMLRFMLLMFAAHFGEQHLRFVSESDFYREIPKLREKLSDRAIIRAAHFFGENRRASDEAAALKNGDINGFLDLVRQSGNSSATLLQNHFSCANPENQSISLAIMLSQHFLGDKGAVRVHGGGFAGTIQAFVPVDFAEKYIAEMNRVFGEGSCVKIKIRPVGGVEITKE